jgi:hypothetical protein
VGSNVVLFTVEKSKDGKNFTKIIDVPCAATAVCYKDYAEVDYKPYNGKSYYRLKQTDVNGVCKYSNIIAVNFTPQKNNAVNFNVVKTP